MRCQHDSLFRNGDGIYECEAAGCDFTVTMPEYNKLRAKIAELEAERDEARGALPIAPQAFVVRAARPGDVVFLTLQRSLDSKQHQDLLHHLQVYTANLGIKFVVLGPEFAPVEIQYRADGLSQTTRGAGEYVALQKKSDSQANEISQYRAGIGRILDMTFIAGVGAGHAGVEAECRKLLDIKSDDGEENSASSEDPEPYVPQESDE